MSHLSRHPALGKLWDSVEGETGMGEAVAEMCHMAVREKQFRSGEEPFRFGDRCAGMSLATAGQFDYHPGEVDFSSLVSAKDALKTLPGQWLSELSLWVQWNHRGLL